MAVTLDQEAVDSLEWVHLAVLVALDMSALLVITNTKAVLVHVVAQRCSVLTFRQKKMSLDQIRKKVIFHNSVDVWIAACREKDISWTNHEEYKKFIAYLLKNNLNLKAFNLCAHEAGATEEEKTKFAEILAETKDDPNSLTYTIKLSDNALDIIRGYSF